MHDEVACLRHRNELAGRNPAALRVPPSSEGLQPNYSSACDVHLRLVMKLQFTVLRGVPQVIFELQTLHCEYSGSRHEEPKSVAAVMFYFMHRLISVGNQDVRRGVVKWISRNSHARRQMQLNGFDAVRSTKPLDNLIRHSNNAVGFRGLNENEEFIAAQASDNICAADHLS